MFVWPIRLENLTVENKGSVTVYQVIIEIECVYKSDHQDASNMTRVESIPCRSSCFMNHAISFPCPRKSLKRMVKSHGPREKIITVLVKLNRKVHGEHHYSAVRRSIHERQQHLLTDYLERKNRLALIRSSEASSWRSRWERGCRTLCSFYLRLSCQKAPLRFLAWVRQANWQMGSCAVLLI